jgi:hypothetical protein
VRNTSAARQPVWHDGHSGRPKSPQICLQMPRWGNKTEGMAISSSPPRWRKLGDTSAGPVNDVPSPCRATQHRFTSPAESHLPASPYQPGPHLPKVHTPPGALRQMPVRSASTGQSRPDKLEAALEELRIAKNFPAQVWNRGM